MIAPDGIIDEIIIVKWHLNITLLYKQTRNRESDASDTKPTCNANKPSRLQLLIE